MPEITVQLTNALAGRYRIEKHLGEGGMATVYLAHDLRHDRKVALKVLRPELAAVIGSDRFLNEIKTTANLQHPHILPLHDSGDADGFLFYVMPYIEGDSLRDKLDRERQLPIEEAVGLTKAIAGALDYAHRQGVIHRDIKPANILIHDGQPLVADFGIALAVTQASGQRLTETGLSIGTPHYMSPEQAVGDREVDTRSDIYSLAAMLYEMLAGEPPYQGSTAQAILAKILTAKAEPVSKDRDTIPPHVDAAIAKALNRHPADRFATATAFAEALANPGFALPTAASATPTEVATTSSLSRRRTAAIAGVASVLAAAVAFLAGRATVPEAPSMLARFVVPAPEGTRYGPNRCCGPQLALSPDGQWLAFTTIEGELYRRRLGQLEAERISGDGASSMPFFSPDGRWLGFYSNTSRRVLKVPMSGGPAVPIAEPDFSPEGLSWGDNDVIVLADLVTGRLYTMPGAGGAPAEVPTAESAGLRHPWMLPGGDAALLTLEAPSPEDTHVVAVDLTTGAIDTLGFGTRAAYASGFLLSSGADGTLLAQPFDAAARRTTGPSVALLDGVALNGPPRLGQFWPSATGGLVYHTGGAGTETLVIDGPEGSTPLPLPQQGDLDLEDVAFSPDSRRIAIRLQKVGDTEDIWIFDRDQETLQRLTTVGIVNMNPVWSPDGLRIAFMHHGEGVGGGGEIYWQPADGSGPAEPLVTGYRSLPSSWSPDGRTLALAGNPDGRSQDIGLLTLGDSTPRWVVASEFAESDPQISPDGRWLAYVSNRSGESEVYVEPLEGGARVQVSTSSGFAPRWAPDRDVLYYASGLTLPRTIVAAELSTERGFRVVSRTERFDIEDIDYDVSPDGREIVHIADTSYGRTELVWILDWPEIVREMTSAR